MGFVTILFLFFFNRRLNLEINEQKKSEGALRESEEQFRSVFENSGIGMVLVDRNGRYQKVNQALSAVLGYTQQELLSMGVQDTSLPGEPDHDSIVRQIWNGEINHLNLEKNYAHKDGHVVRGDVSLSAICDAEGKVLYIVDQIQDITDRKQAENELKFSAERFERWKASNFIGIIQSNSKGDINDANDTLLTMLGYSRQDLLERKIDWTKLTPPEFLHLDKKAMEEAADKGFWTPFEKEYFHKNGHRIPIIIGGSVFKEFPDDYIVFIIDITARKKMEEEREELQEQLLQSRKMDAMGTLAGGIAHEFNNILGIIIGNAELAFDDVPEWNPAKNCLAEIKTASLRAKDVVRQILSFTRKTPAERKPIQISTIVKESLKLIRATIPTTIEIKQNVFCDDELILGNPTEVNQILLNLCSNAAHAMLEGEGSLDITLEAITLDEKAAAVYEDLTSGDYVKLGVKDTGTGIDREIKDRIFDPYFTTKDVGEGVGMGLAIVYGLVKKHDGAISLASEVEKGTIVEVLFPIVEGEVEEPTDTSETMPTGTERILFVDDEPSLAEMVNQVLTRLGYNVEARTSSLEALELFKAEPDRFDLVITDMAMPEMAGDRLAKELITIRHDIPIILSSGHSERMDKDRARKLGIKAYIMKPLVMKGIAQKIREVLDKKSIRRK